MRRLDEVKSAYNVPFAEPPLGRNLSGSMSNSSATRYPLKTLRNECKRGLQERGFKFLSAREQAADRKEMAKRQLDLPRRDKRQRLAAEGAEYATGYLKSSPCYYQPAVFSTPEMNLEMFILQPKSTELDSTTLLSRRHTRAHGANSRVGYLSEGFIVSSPPLPRGLPSRSTRHSACARRQRAMDSTHTALASAGGNAGGHIKIPTEACETSSEVIDLGGTRNALREVVTTKYTTGKITTAVNFSRVYRLKSVRGKLVCDRSDVFSPPPSHVTYFLS
ncbi:hypothetical protein AB1N83_010187 [Pleurotus pulmonarius]